MSLKICGRSRNYATLFLRKYKYSNAVSIDRRCGTHLPIKDVTSQHRFLKSTDSICLLPKFKGVTTHCARFHLGQNVNNCKESAPEQELDDVCQAFLQCPNSESVLDMVENKVLSPQQTCIAFSSIFQLKYNELCQKYSWLQHNESIAYIQLLINYDMDSAMFSIWNHSNMQNLLNNFEQNIDKFTDEQCINCVYYLCYMDMDKTEALYRKMITETEKRIPNFNLANLHTAALVSRSTVRGNWKIWKGIIQRQRHFLNVPTEEFSAEDTHDFLCGAVFSVLLQSIDLRRSVVEKSHQLIKNGENISDPKYLAAFTRFLRTPMFYVIFDGSPYKSEMVDILIEATRKQLPRFTHEHIAVIGQNLRYMRSLDHHLSRAMEEKAHDLLNEDLRLAEVSNLLYGIQRNSTFLIRNDFDRVLFHKMDQIDLVILSNIADNMNSSHQWNIDLVICLQGHIVRQAAKLYRFPSRFVKIARMLFNQGFKLREHEEEFCKIILNQMDKMPLHNSTLVSSFSWVLLSMSSRHIDEQFMHRILSEVPTLSATELCRITLVMSQMTPSKSPALRKQFSQLQNVFYTSVAEKISTVYSLGNLHRIGLGLVVHNRHRDPFLTEKIMSAISNCVESRNQLRGYDISKVIHIFLSINYFDAKVCDRIADFVIERQSLTKGFMNRILQLFSKVGYIPKKTEVFTEAVLNSFKDNESPTDVHSLLVTLTHLAEMQCFPEDELRDIFNIHFIESVDKYMESNPKHRESLEELMFKLNRIVCLECPQLDIPWFHDQYCKDNVVKDEVQDHGSFYMRFHDEVEEVLQQILNGQKYVRRWVYSPYYHLINFECVLDENNEAVPGTRFSVLNMKEWQRVALLLLQSADYCHDSEQLIGAQDSRKRHLEIMGYKVITVPHFEWYSMGLNDWEYKVDYLQNKIFSESQSKK